MYSLYNSYKYIIDCYIFLYLAVRFGTYFVIEYRCNIFLYDEKICKVLMSVKILKIRMCDRACERMCSWMCYVCNFLIFLLMVASLSLRGPEM